MKTIDEIKALIQFFEQTSLTSLEWIIEGVTVKLTKPRDGLHARTQPAQAEANASCQGLVVKSPLVGVFYSALTPEQDPFVQVGSVVEKGDTLCIIEAMKTMNEIKAPITGKILKIHAKNKEFVGFEQPLFSIQHDA